MDTSSLNKSGLFLLSDDENWDDVVFEDDFDDEDDVFEDEWDDEQDDDEDWEDSDNHWSLRL
jgi:hypothetical protein